MSEKLTASEYPLYTLHMNRAAFSRFAALGWLAVLLSVSSVADQVIDLVFEERDVTVETNAVGDVAEDPSENLLIPSPGGDLSSTQTVVWVLSADYWAGILTPDIAVSCVAASYHPPPRTVLSAYSVPLRI